MYVFQSIDNKDLSSLSLPWLRGQMGLVAQEPVLFDLTIRENITYGDNSRDVHMDEIIAAARLANIHSFIENLPLVGYIKINQYFIQNTAHNKYFFLNT